MSPIRKPCHQRKNYWTHRWTKDNIPIWWFERKKNSLNWSIWLLIWRAHVIGRDDAVDKSAAIRRNRVGLGCNRPIGSFLFVGPTGVRKTNCPKQLAIELFWLCRQYDPADMSEYMQTWDYETSRAPSNMLTTMKTGQLVEERFVTNHTRVVGWSGKSPSNVMHMFLQVLDGRLTDGQATVSKDTIIVTWPLMLEPVKAEANVGFGAAREGRTNSLLGELGNFFSPEFMNRLMMASLNSNLYQKIFSNRYPHARWSNQRLTK